MSQLARISEHDLKARQLLVAHREFLDAAIEVVRLWPVDGPAALVLSALSMRLLQRGAAAHTLCVSGYAAEAGPLLRVMLSALASITYIAASDSDSRALAFLAEETRVARNRLPRLGDQGLLTTNEATRLLHESESFNTERIAHYAKLGIQLDKPDRPGRSWHGYPNDEQFFTGTGLKAWYDSFYASFSEDSHASAWSLLTEIQALARGDLAFGPHYGNNRDLRFAIASSLAFVTRCLFEFDAAQNLGRHDHIVAFSEVMRRALAQAFPPRDSSGSLF